MRNTLKTIGLYFGAILALVGLWMIGLLLIKGGVWLSERVTPWLFYVSQAVLFIAFLGLLPLCASKETRGVGGIGLYVASYVFGVTLWFWSLLVTYTLWGEIALIIGLLIAGVGVLPIALLATVFKGEWKLLGELFLLLVATFGTRFLGLHFLALHERDSGEPDTPIRLIVATWLLFACSFIPYLGYVAFIPFIVCSIVLCCSKSRKAKRHGRVLLSLIAVLVLTLFAIGFIYYDRFPARQ